MERYFRIGIGVVVCVGLSVAAAAGKDLASFLGETITYSIKQVGVKAGEATLSCEGPVMKDGKEFVLFVFRADGFNFWDEEKIYAHPETLFPHMVERDLNIFGNKERIVEYYEPQAGRVRIVKTADDKTTEQILEKQGQLDNIYCFIYRYRRDGRFKIGDILKLSLPTQDIEITLVRKNSIGAGGKKYDAFYMQSNPAKYKIWFAADEQKTPLRIDGAVGVGKTSMVMREYKE